MIVSGATVPSDRTRAVCTITRIDPSVGRPTAYTIVTVPGARATLIGPRIGPVVRPVGNSATRCVPAGTSASANSPLAMLVKTVRPSTCTSAGATVAVWATSTRALPGPIALRGVV